MKTRPLILSLMIAVPATLSFAQGPGQPPPGGRPPGPPPGESPRGPHHGPPPPPPLLVALDKDKDGIISAAEIAEAPAALKTLDKNGDGQLTPDELHPPRPDGPPPGEERPRPKKPHGPAQPHADKHDEAGGPKNEGDRPPAPPWIKALDADGDGVISAAEIANASVALATLDKNGDGQLGPMEYGPRPPAPPTESDQSEPPAP